MKIHAFGVVPFDGREPLEALLAEIEQTPLEQRVRSVLNTDYRIEDIEFRNNGLWYLDFNKFRDGSGPGAASRETPIRGFEFRENEVFCEETAFVYDPASRHAVIQYNHYGARVGSIQEYFNVFAQNEVYIYEFRPRYDDDVDRKFRDRAATRKITFAIDPRFLNNNDREAGTALSEAIDIGNSSNGNRIEITVSAGHEPRRYLSKYIERTAVALKRKAEQNPDAIPKLQVGVVPNLDSAVEVLDLIAQRMSVTFDDLHVGADRRYSRDERYRALTRAFNGWRRLFVP